MTNDIITPDEPLVGGEDDDDPLEGCAFGCKAYCASWSLLSGPSAGDDSGAALLDEPAASAGADSSMDNILSLSGEMSACMMLPRAAAAIVDARASASGIAAHVMALLLSNDLRRTMTLTAYAMRVCMLYPRWQRL